MCHRAHSPAGVGAATAARPQASTQTDLQMVGTALRVSGCSECLGPPPEAGEMVPFPEEV